MYVALLEDDPDQHALLMHWLDQAGHQGVGWHRMGDFMRDMANAHFDAVVLDWKLPDGSGMETLKWIRQTVGWNVAVVVLTACDDADTVVQALGAGADDYVVKPAREPELVARIATAVRRASPGGVMVVKLGIYEVDIPRHQLSMHGKPVTMTQKEFDLGAYFFQNPGKLLSRDHLLNKIWGLNTEVDTRTVDTHVSRLRKKLKLDGSHGWQMGSVYGYGYRLDRATAGPCANAAAGGGAVARHDAATLGKAGLSTVAAS
ncbi:MAG: response regulator transcription factor [Aquabacterium sp.]|nr:response regulator transcription factor [Aquabacterium sp.]